MSLQTHRVSQKDLFTQAGCQYTERKQSTLQLLNLKTDCISRGLYKL